MGSARGVQAARRYPHTVRLRPPLLYLYFVSLYLRAESADISYSSATQSVRLTAMTSPTFLGFLAEHPTSNRYRTRMSLTR